MENIFALLDKYREDMAAALSYIWKNPETGFREWKTHAYMKNVFESYGYTLTEAGDIPGFYTDIDTGRAGPRILVLAEMDSLICCEHPEADLQTGAVHACGHNAQCAAMVGIAAVLSHRQVLQDLSGSIRLCVVPAEELIESSFREELRLRDVIKYYGGKVEFMRRGYFDGCHMAFMVHTQVGKPHAFYLYKGGNGCITKNVTYHGKAAHAGGAPHNGINALYAANLGLSAINALRETFCDRDHIRTHHIITEGGAVCNAIPDTIKLESSIRGASMEAIIDVNRRVNRALAGSALAMGANVTISDRPGYMPLINSAVLNKFAYEAFGAVTSPDAVSLTEGWNAACTDMGDLSAVIPAIHPHCSGAIGECHGATYYVNDFESACVTSARGQLSLLRHLLECGATRANEVALTAKPRYSSFEEYFNVLESVLVDTRAIEYGSGSAQVKY